MAAALVYAAVAAALLAAAHRWVRPLSRAAAAALVVLPLLFTGRALLTGRVYGPIDLAYSAPPLRPYHSDFGVPALAHNGALSDVYCAIIPWQAAVRRAWSEGEWPLSNPSALCGDLLAGAAQAAPYHPIHLAGLVLPLPASLGYAATATLLLAGLGMFLFSRDLGCRESAALIGAAGWMWCDYMAWWLLWPLAPAVAALPLVLLGVRRVVEDPRPRSALLLAGALALALLGGHPESAAHVAGLGILWGVAALAARRPRRWLRPLIAALAGGLLALLVCAVYLLPILDALDQSAERRWRAGAYATADRSVPWHEVGPRALHSVMPFAFGRPGWGSESLAALRMEPGGGYAGSLLLPLAAWGVGASRCRARWLLLAIALLGVLAGAATPGVADLLARIPPYDLAINERLAFAFAFGVTALAALGVEALAAGAAAGPRRAFVYGFLALGALLAVVLPRAGAALEPSQLARYPLLYLVPLGAAAALVGPRVGRWTAPVLIILLAVQRGGESGAIYPVYAARAFYPEVAPLTALPRGGEPYRVVGLGYTLVPNMATIWGLDDPRGYQPLTLGRLLATYPLWSERIPLWFNMVARLDRPFLSFLNVRYALARASDVTPADWPVVAEARNMKLVENPRVLARAFVPPRVRRGGSARRVRREIWQETDFGQRTWIEVPGERPQPIRGYANGPGRVEIRRDGSGYRLEAEMERRGYVVTSIAAWRGWRAVVAGRELPLAYANHAFVAFSLPVGRHEVRLRYLPASFVWGRAITFASLAGLGIAGSVAWAGKRWPAARSGAR